MGSSAAAKSAWLLLLMPLLLLQSGTASAHATYGFVYRIEYDPLMAPITENSLRELATAAATAWNYEIFCSSNQIVLADTQAAANKVVTPARTFAVAFTLGGFSKLEGPTTLIANTEENVYIPSVDLGTDAEVYAHVLRRMGRALGYDYLPFKTAPDARVMSHKKYNGTVFGKTEVHRLRYNAPAFRTRFKDEPWAHIAGGTSVRDCHGRNAAFKIPKLEKRSLDKNDLRMHLNAAVVSLRRGGPKQASIKPVSAARMYAQNYHTISNFFGHSLILRYKSVFHARRCGLVTAGGALFEITDPNNLFCRVAFGFRTVTTKETFVGLTPDYAELGISYPFSHFEYKFLLEAIPDLEARVGIYEGQILNPTYIVLSEKFPGYVPYPDAPIDAYLKEDKTLPPVTEMTCNGRKIQKLIAWRGNPYAVDVFGHVHDSCLSEGNRAGGNITMFLKLMVLSDHAEHQRKPDLINPPAVSPGVVQALEREAPTLPTPPPQCSEKDWTCTLKSMLWKSQEQMDEFDTSPIPSALPIGGLMAVVAVVGFMYGLRKQCTFSPFHRAANKANAADMPTDMPDEAPSPDADQFPPPAKVS